jgi:hypothetical protein
MGRTKRLALIGIALALVVLLRRRSRDAGKADGGDEEAVVDVTA